MEKVIQKHGGAINRVQKGEVLNPNGRPKKSFTKFNDDMKKAGYEPLTKGALIEAYSLIFSIDEKVVAEIANDETQPLALRLILQSMTDPQSRDKALADYRNYMFGEAKRETESRVIFKGFDADVPADNSPA